MRTLILGGARSGKSRLACVLAGEGGAGVTLIATATAGDEEMRRRIERHRAERPAGWQVVEEPLLLARALRDHARDGSTVIVDCLTLWLSNLMLAGDETCLERERPALLEQIPRTPGTLILVSNETGLGIVPGNALARDFRDQAGLLHQAVAQRCERVVMTVAGLPLWLKGGPG